MSAILDRVLQEQHPVRYFVLEGAAAVAESEKYRDAYFAAHLAREELLAKYGADGYIATDAGFEALVFNGAAPKGWVRQADVIRAYKPDYVTEAGFASARDIHSEAIAYPATKDVAKALGLAAMQVIDGEVRKPVVQVLDGVHVVTVPRTMISGNTLVGAREISHDVYLEMREEALNRAEPEPEQASRARPR